MTRETVLVTGSSGLIGSAVCAVLGARGHAVRRFDIADRQGGEGDICAPALVDRAMQGCTGVIHLAAVSRVIWGERDPAHCHRTNVVGTANIIAALQDRGLRPWLILASSREVYGQSRRLPVREDAPLRPMNHYARSKVEAERAVMQASAAGLRTAVVRFSTVYGALGDHPDRVIPAFCRAALNGLPLRVEGEANRLDITHIADVAPCIADVAERLSRGQSLEPMHLTSGQGVSLSDLAATVVRLARSNSTIVTASPRDYDVASFIGDPARARAQAGWRPSMPLETGLQMLIAQLSGGMERADADGVQRCLSV